MTGGVRASTQFKIRALAFSLSFVAGGFAALGKDPLVHSISVAPGGRYAIEATEDRNLGLMYQLRDLRKKLPLLRMRSSYQQEPGDGG